MAVMSTHHPLAFAFGILGNIISIMVFLAPVPTFFRIYRKKSTEGFQSLPYLVALFGSMLWLHYAMLKKDAFLLITINGFGCVIETLYIILYIVYATKENRISTFRLLLSMNMGLFSFIIILTHCAVKDSVRVQVLGWICVAVSVSVFAAPLSIVALVIRTRSVEFMPFNLSFFLTISAIVWFVYGLATKDMCVALPNVLGFILGLLQMLLYAVYRKAKKVIMEEKLAENLKTIVNISTLGNSEVHPMDVQPESNEAAKEHEQKEDNKDNNEKSLGTSKEDPHPNENAV
ncbi:hypothetical protein P3X46_011477 [Hevea brasiliensis]|uniref:Uncharacterized protein n=2 Tax=Hevea brasiliensis TaxID=3981 RepID=A0ABQ9M771_HEVBR|nr:bidirectional sugar transporter N3-like [Hevea brasiliensis]KAF2286452.1 hypothetical protein GH714_017035 [Hevea brasiliensis]KAJ9176132.1 hypothetical protein P3X46_011477 [Hevea brasiliensis]